MNCKSWEIEFDGVTHCVEVVHRPFWGGLRLSIDGEVVAAHVLHEVELYGYRVDFRDHEILLNVYPPPPLWRYELGLDGRVVDSGEKFELAPQRPNRSRISTFLRIFAFAFVCPLAFYFAVRWLTRLLKFFF